MNDQTYQTHVELIVGSGVLGERRLIAPSATRVRVVGELCAQLVVGSRTSRVLWVRGDDNIVPHVTARVRGGVLELGLIGGEYRLRCPLIVSGTWAELVDLHTSTGARVRLTGVAGATVALVATGASEIDAHGSARSWKLASEGQAHVQLMAAEADIISVTARGASNVGLRGGTRHLRLDARGAARATAAAPDFEARDVRVNLAGAASACVAAADGVSGRVHVPALLRARCGGRIDIAGSYRRD